MIVSVYRVTLVNVPHFHALRTGGCDGGCRVEALPTEEMPTSGEDGTS